VRCLSKNNDSDSEIDVWILNGTGILLFVRVDEFKIDEASITIDIAQLPALESSTKANDIIEQGTLYGVKLYPNEAPNGGFFKSHRLILKNEEAIDVIKETETDDDTNTTDITYTIKPKYTPAVIDDYYKM